MPLALWQALSSTSAEGQASMRREVTLAYVLAEEWNECESGVGESSVCSRPDFFPCHVGMSGVLIKDGIIITGTQMCLLEATVTCALRLRLALIIGFKLLPTVT